MGRTLNQSTRQKFFTTKPEVCELCGDGPREDDKWTVDHVVEWADLGSNHFLNLAKVHESCNLIKGAAYHYELLENERIARNRPPIISSKELRIQRVKELIAADIDVSILFREEYRNNQLAQKKLDEESLDGEITYDQAS